MIKSYMSFTYITGLMFLFIYIFSLLGMSIFAGILVDPDGVTPRGNYDSFGTALITVFQVMTMENWQTVLFDSMRGGSKYVVAIFYISWIFLGNFIILNLFLAILLDSFLEEDEEDDLIGDAEYKARKIKKAMIKKK